MQKLLFSLLLITILSCTKNDENIMCTMEFRSIVIQITDADNKNLPIDTYFVIKESTNDTIINNLSYAMDNEINNGITVFTDSELQKTTEKGVDFILHVYQKNNLIVNQKYTFAHDKCHVKLSKGPTTIVVNSIK